MGFFRWDYMKTCRKCNQTKSLGDFYKDSSREDGKKTICIVCDKVNVALYALNNKEKRKATSTHWYAKNAARVKQVGLAYRKANPDRVKATKKRYNENKIARGKLSPYLYVKLFKLQKGMCACCGKLLDGVGDHMDHKMPLALGGTNTDDNIQLLHQRCNNQKSSKHPIDFMQSMGFLL